MRIGKLVLVAACGGVVGVAVGYSLTRPESTADVPKLRAVTDGDAHPSATESARPTVSSTTAGRADLYRVAAAAPRSELDAMLREAAARPHGTERTFALSLLLTRYAELDPKAAVAAAAGFPAELRAPLYATWAKTDPASALAALAAVQDRAAARTIAAALVTALGGDDHALREVAAAVPFGVESAVYADALTARAAEAPAVAFRQAIDLTDAAARSQALEGIAAHWARLDPRAALTAVDEIYDASLRQAFLAGVAKTWARLDPDATLAYLKSADVSARPDLLMAVGAQLAQMRPRELLEIAATNTPVSQSLRLMAVRGLANQDPALALREAEALPAGGQRESAIGEIARVYGARDPEAALAWARASGDTARITGVIQGIAQRDPARAFDLAVAIESPQQRMQAVQRIAMTAPIASGWSGATIADRVLALPEDLRVGMLPLLLSRWSATAPEAAVEWLLAHQGATQGGYLQVAQQLARSNPAQAAEYTTRVPPAARSEWIQGMAAGYAQTNPQAAAEWLEQYRSDPAYSAAAASVAAGLARVDPPAAARLLATAKDPEVAMQGAYAVATQWAQRDPRAAAAWAAEYDASLGGRTAVSPNVVGIWAQSDTPAARAWTLRMTSGAARDSALSALLSAHPTAIDTALLDAFSNAQMRNQAVVNTAMRLSNSDRVAAARLLDAYVTDDTMREQAKRNLERNPTNVYYDGSGAIGVGFSLR